MKTKTTIPFKGTKKQKAERDRRDRVLARFNTGTVTMASKKDYSRKENKILLTKIPD